MGSRPGGPAPQSVGACYAAGVSYFDQLGGNNVVMPAAEFVALSAPERLRFAQGVAEQMAPAVLGRAAAAEGVATIRGRYAVHNVTVELSAEHGGLSLRLNTRRTLNLPGGRVVIGGAPDDPSRQFLSDLPQGTGALLNRLLDTTDDFARSLTIASEEVVLVLEDPALMLLSIQPAQRLTSVTHLTAYISVEAEERWPLDPAAPLTMPTMDSELERRLQWGESELDMPPVPGYGIPPDAVG